MTPKDTSLTSPIHILRLIFSYQRAIKSNAITICKLELALLYPYTLLSIDLILRFKFTNP